MNLKTIKNSILVALTTVVAVSGCAKDANIPAPTIVATPQNDQQSNEQESATIEFSDSDTSRRSGTRVR